LQDAQRSVKKPLELLKTEMVTLFDSIRIGAWDLPNRIIMAPLTRHAPALNASPTR
jgi:2,4-dienoyl-CoA reductase-like NADH-dependent reductase (Old Yellow Enzyme family)